MHTVFIYISHFPQPLSSEHWQAELAHLPTPLQGSIQRYHQWQDRHARLLGKRLLQKGLQNLGLDHSLNDLQLNQNGRPFLKSHPQLDFNISHTAQAVICVLSLDCRVGIDIEMHHPLDISAFKPYFSQKIWKQIEHGQHKTTNFLRFWTQKEATAKADGGGIKLLKLIDLETQYALINHQKWFLFDVNLESLETHKKHISSLACSVKNIIQQRHLISFY
jgi:4'-phosphopantetheinyl transferase